MTREAQMTINDAKQMTAPRMTREAQLTMNDARSAIDH